MAYSNSSLVVYTQISPNRNSPRNHSIDRISIHCVVGQVTAEGLGSIFAPSSKGASSNYGVDKNGRVGLYVEEKDRSWCTSSSENDNRAVTIETASDTYEPYRVTDAAFNTLLDLCEDICRRNGKKKLLWFGDKEKTLSYTPKSDEMVLTVHRWFANKSCPGDYLYSRHGEIAEEVTKRLNPVPEEADDLTEAEVRKIAQDEIAKYFENLANREPKEGDWSYEHVQKVKELGIMEGDPDGKFRPKDLVTREELATVVVKTVDYIEKK